MRPKLGLSVFWLLFLFLAAPIVVHAGTAPVKIRVAYGPVPTHVIPVIFANPEVTPNNGKAYMAELISIGAWP